MEYLILGGAILFVTCLLLFWAGQIRRPKKQRYERPKAPVFTDTQTGAAQFLKHRRKRKRRSAGPRANPTLAETRGLPPVREDHRGNGGRSTN